MAPSGPPDFEVVRGNPTPEEEQAIREAILRLWRDEQIEARRASAMSGWVVAARAEATGSGAPDFRTRTRAWQFGERLTGLGLVSVRRTGRGDSK